MDSDVSESIFNLSFKRYEFPLMFITYKCSKVKLRRIINNSLNNVESY